MSGHSKWSKIKHTKGVADARKGAVFTKLGHLITVAARQGGGDPEKNFNLRLTIDRAKKSNLPKDNIERAIKRGTGELIGEEIEEILYEAFGPEGSAVLIKALTSNKNRTVSNLRRIFNKHSGNLGEKNSVRWMFEEKGVIGIEKSKIEDLEKIELKAIDLGAEDIKIEENELIVYTKIEELEKIKQELEKQGLEIDYAEMEWIPKDEIEISSVSQNKLKTIFNELEEDPDVNDYYTNVK